MRAPMEAAASTTTKINMGSFLGEVAPNTTGGIEPVEAVALGSVALIGEPVRENGTDVSAAPQRAFEGGLRHSRTSDELHTNGNPDATITRDLPPPQKVSNGNGLPVWTMSEIGGNEWDQYTELHGDPDPRN